MSFIQLPYLLQRFSIVSPLIKWPQIAVVNCSSSPDLCFTYSLHLRQSAQLAGSQYGSAFWYPGNRHFREKLYAVAAGGGGVGIAQRNCMALPRDQLGCEGYHGYTLILLTALQPKQKQQKQPRNDKSRQLVYFTVAWLQVFCFNVNTT